MWNRNASVAPHTIADSTAASARPKEADRIAKEAAAIATIPAASESIPSIRFTRFASSAIHRIVSGYATQPMSKSPMPGSVTRSNVTPKPATGISAISVTPSSLRLGVTPCRSSKSPSAATSSVPMKMPR